ncbi:hypothetical protein [Suipraeoptans intestinalis]|nr:hypothetical protein [Suipraeoptans intestinalis]
MWLRISQIPMIPLDTAKTITAKIGLTTTKLRNANFQIEVES